MRWHEILTVRVIWRLKLFLRYYINYKKYVFQHYRSYKSKHYEEVHSSLLVFPFTQHELVLDDAFVPFLNNVSLL